MVNILPNQAIQTKEKIMTVDYKYCSKIINDFKEASGFKRTFLAYDNNISIKKGDTFFPEFANNIELTNSKHAFFIQNLSESVISVANNDSYYQEWCSVEGYQNSNGDINYGILFNCAKIIGDILNTEIETSCSDL